MCYLYNLRDLSRTLLWLVEILFIRKPQFDMHCPSPQEEHDAILIKREDLENGLTWKEYKS